jgi:hypothetical protein
MSLLTARGVSVSFGALAVLREASLAVAAGDRIAVVGPNGVGKTTLLKVLAGLAEPDAGTVSAAGTVGYLPQERDRRDGESAMAYLARRTGVAAAEADMLAASQRLATAGGGAAGAPSEARAGRDYAAASTPTWPWAVPILRSGPPSWRRNSACPPTWTGGPAGTRAARRRGWRWRPCCWRGSTFCCSTSRPTTWT